MWVRFLIFGVVATLISTLLHRYLWARLVRDAELPAPWGRVATIAIVALAILMPLSMFLSRGLPRALGSVVAYVGYGWLGLLFLAFMLLLLGDLVRLVLLAIPQAEAGLTRDAGVHVGRRLLLGRGIALATSALAVGLGAWGFVNVARGAAVKAVRVALARLPKKLDGLVIVQLTDIHVGPTIGRGFLEDVVRRTNELSPDVAAITGDLVDGTVDDLREHVAPLAKLRAKHGVYFVTGNHEYYSGVDAWIAELERIGVRVLRNERVEIRVGDDVIDLAGVDDHSARRVPGHGPDLKRALEGRDPARELILLAHQPKAIEEAAALGVGLQLSGHTHGGQIWPWRYLVYLQQPYVSGLHRHGDAQIYVSRGTGYWGPPMRLGADAEITKLTLVRG
jgi:hypothetical protein